jgi:hypothetical protein
VANQQASCSSSCPLGSLLPFAARCGLWLPTTPHHHLSLSLSPLDLLLLLFISEYLSLSL